MKAKLLWYAVLTASALLLGAGSALGDDEATEQAIQAELKKLEGRWERRGLEQNGQEQGSAEGRDMLIEGEKLAWLDGERRDVTAEIRLQPASTPRAIDLLITMGSDNGAKQLGIYELKGDTLKLCLAAPNKTKRPTKFTTRAVIGAGVLVFTYKRVKEDAAQPVVEAAAASEREIAAEMKKLEGNWQRRNVEQFGRDHGAGEDEGLLIEDDKLSWLQRQRSGVTADFTVNPANRPRTIDLRITRGSDNGAKQLGIYELKGDTLKICLAAPNKTKRPTKFTTRAVIGAGVIVYTYKRAKDE